MISVLSLRSAMNKGRTLSVHVARNVTVSVFYFYKQKMQNNWNKVREFGRLFTNKLCFRRHFYSICALPWNFNCICERHHFRSLRRHCDIADTNVCHPTAYQRYHSVPRSVTRLKAVKIRLLDHSAIGGVRKYYWC